MTWQNLGEELEELFADKRPDTGATVPEVTYRDRISGSDADRRWWQRKVQTARRENYTSEDRNRSYTIRGRAQRTQPRGKMRKVAGARPVIGRGVAHTTCGPKKWTEVTTLARERFVPEPPKHTDRDPLTGRLVPKRTA